MSARIDVVSGRFQGSIPSLKREIGGAIVKAAIFAIEEALNEWLPTVAREFGLMQNALRAMFLQQTTTFGITGTGASTVYVDFKRALLTTPYYLKYHDIEWELNRYYMAGEPYLNPSTLGTEPFSENKIIHIIRQKMLYYLSIEFSKLGLNYTAYANVR